MNNLQRRRCRCLNRFVLVPQFRVFGGGYGRGGGSRGGGVGGGGRGGGDTTHNTYVRDFNMKKRTEIIIHIFNL